MLTIRLQRIGKNKRPSYRVIISEKGRDPHARSLEILGSYNPLGTKKFEVNKERISYWITKGAQMSDTIHNLFLKEGVTSGKKKKMSVSLTKKRRGKIAAKKAEAEKTTAEAAPATA